MRLFYMPRENTDGRRTSGSKQVYALLGYAFYLLHGGEKLPIIKKTPNGKPFFPDRPEIHFSLSHSAAHVLCAISDAPVGADIESPRVITPRAVRYFCSQRELQCFKPLELWVLKESFLKLKGGRLSDMKKIRFSRDGDRITAHDPTVSVKLFRINDGQDNCLIAISTTGELPHHAEYTDATVVSRAL